MTATDLLLAPGPAALQDHQLARALETCLIDYWVHDLYPGYQALIASVRASLFAKGQPECSEKAFRGRVYYQFRVLAEKGCYTAQAAKATVLTSLGEGRPGHAAYWLNLSPVSVEGATLGHITRACLSAVGGLVSPAGDSARFRSAMRLLLDLPARCNDHEIHAAASREPITRVLELPARVFDKALGAGQSVQSAKNLRTAMRAAMRFAAQLRACPIVFRAEATPSDEWIEVMNRWFPLTATGLTPRRIRANRKAIRALATAAAEHLDPTPTPYTISWAEVASIADFLSRKKGNARGARDVQRVALRLAEARVGRLAEPRPTAEFTVSTPSGPRPSIYLRDANGSAKANNWDGFIDLLSSHQLPDATIDLISWYGRWVTAPAETVFYPGHDEPPVLAKHCLSITTLGKRSTELRAWIGCAITVCGLQPGELTPTRLFGTHFATIARALIGWWRARAKAIRQEGKQFGAATRGTLHHIIITAGILAYAGYARERHRNGHGLMMLAADGQNIDLFAELAAVKSTNETPLLLGYEQSVKMGSALKRQRNRGATGRKAVSNARTRQAPEFKSINRVVEHTPPAWWLDVLDAMHARIRADVQRKEDRGTAFHHRVQDAWELGTLISTGFRGEELCRLRLGVHLKRGETKVVLEADERKNVKRQEAFIQPRYVPMDIHELYLDRTLPWLQGGQFEELARRKDDRGGSNCETAARLARARAKQHDFLIVNRRGGAPGEPLLEIEELLESQPANSSAVAARTHAFKVAVMTHGRRWKDAMIRRAVEAGKSLPENLNFEFGRHCIRGSFGYAIVQTLGLVAAANYLGDTMSTVELAYSAVNGANVDTSVVANFRVPDRGIRPASTCPEDGKGATAERDELSAGAQEKRLTADEAEYLRKEEQLRADLRSGVVTRKQYDDTLSLYQRRYLSSG